MQPVALRGLTGIALPLAEFDVRVAAIQRELAGLDLEAFVAHGDARHYAPLAWVTGFVPMLRWGIAVVPAQGGVELFLATPGPRDLPAMRRLAVASGVEGIAALEHSLRRFGRVALAGARYMRASQERTIRSAVGRTCDGDPLLARLAAEPSEAEARLLESAAACAAEASDVVTFAWRAGAGAGPALLDGDLLARERGAHDVRLLCSNDGGRSFRPLTTPALCRPNPFAFYLAVEHGGYWGEAFRTPGAPADEPAVTHPTVAPAARMWLSIEELHGKPSRPGVYSIRTAGASGAVWSRTERIR